ALVEPQAASGSQPVPRILPVHALVAAGLTVSVDLAEGVSQPVREALGVALLHPHLKPVIKGISIAVQKADASQILNPAVVKEFLRRPSSLEIGIGRGVRPVEVRDAVGDVSTLAANVTHGQRRLEG